MIKYLFIFLFLPLPLLASTDTVKELSPAEIAWKKVKTINASTEKERMRIALTVDTTDYDVIKLSPMVDRLAVIELSEEGYARHKAAGRNYAPVIYSGAIKRRKNKLMEIYQVSIGDEIIIDGDTYIVENITYTVGGSTNLITGTTYYIDGSTYVIGKYDEVKGGWLTAITGIIVVFIIGVFAFLKKKD